MALDIRDQFAVVEAVVRIAVVATSGAKAVCGTRGPFANPHASKSS